jgi:GAF domain-containing protein
VSDDRAGGRFTSTGVLVDLPEEVRLADVLTKLALSLLNEKSLKDDLERLARVVCNLIDNCSGASVSMLVEGEPSTVAVTDRVSLQLDLIQYDNNDGPCVTALGGEAIRIGFIPADERFPHFAVGAADRRVLSVLSTPAIDHGSVVGSLNLYSHEEDAFDDKDRDTASIVAAEIACALMKSAVLSQATELRDQLQEQHDTAALVSMAQGVLMAVHSCSQAQARDLIVLAAEENRETLVTVAERILSTVDRDGQATDVDRSSAIDI